MKRGVTSKAYNRLAMFRLPAAAAYWAQLEALKQAMADEHSAPEFRTDMEWLAADFLRGMMAVVRSFWGHLVPASFRLELKFRWEDDAKTSWAGRSDGRAVMSLAMRRACLPMPVIEYPSFNADPVIGYLPTTNPRVHLAATCAHELAHVVQYEIKAAVIGAGATGAALSAWTTENTPHGPRFREIYRKLRALYVNNMILKPAI